jgi:general stress protein YciG
MLLVLMSNIESANICEELINKEVYMANNSTSNRGFASMDESKQKEIASKGGKATGGKNLSRAARAKGGKNSHDNQYTS